MSTVRIQVPAVYDWRGRPFLHEHEIRQGLEERYSGIRDEHVRMMADYRDGFEFREEKDWPHLAALDAYAGFGDRYKLEADQHGRESADRLWDAEGKPLFREWERTYEAEWERQNPQEEPRQTEPAEAAREEQVIPMRRQEVSARQDFYDAVVASNQLQAA